MISKIDITNSPFPTMTRNRNQGLRTRREQKTRQVNFSAATYVIQVHTHGDKTKRQTLSNLDGIDFLDFFSEFFKERTAPHTDLFAKTVFNTKKFKLDAALRTVSGVVESGSFGMASTIRDSGDHKVKHDKTPTESEVLPFRFLVYIPANKYKGLLLLQRTGSNGIYTPFHTLFKERFQAKFPSKTFSIEPIIHNEMIDQFHKNSKTKTIRLRRYRKSTDPTDRTLSSIPEDSYIEYSVNAKRKFDLGRLAFWSPEKITEIFSLVSSPEDEVFYDVVLNGRSRTISSKDPNDIRCYYSLVDKIKIGPNGHPVDSGLELAFNELRDDLWQQIEQEVLE